MQYCINALLKNNNEIMQYYIINNDIAVIMHYCALLQMPDCTSLFQLIFAFLLIHYGIACIDKIIVVNNPVVPTSFAHSRSLLTYKFVQKV